MEQTKFGSEYATVARWIDSETFRHDINPASQASLERRVNALAEKALKALHQSNDPEIQRALALAEGITEVIQAHGDVEAYLEHMTPETKIPSFLGSLFELPQPLTNQLPTNLMWIDPSAERILPNADIVNIATKLARGQSIDGELRNIIVKSGTLPQIQSILGPENAAIVTKLINGEKISAHEANRFMTQVETGYVLDTNSPGCEPVLMIIAVMGLLIIVYFAGVFEVGELTPKGGSRFCASGFCSPS